MAIENAKTLNVRIRNKYDSYENWAKSTLVLESGEIATAYTTVNVEVGNGKIEQHPELLMKVGNGSDVFADLPWLSAKAADVAAWAKAANKPAYEAKEITGIDAYIADYVEEQMGISVDTDTQYQIVKVDDYNYKLQSKGKTDSAWADVANSVIVIPNDTAAIEALQGLVGNTAVATQISNAIAALDLANTYEAKGEAAKVQTALETYKTSNDAAVLANTNAITANSNAITAIKDGTTIDSFADVEAALAGKQATGDYATKTEAQGYANAKDEAIAEAKKAGTDAAAALEAYKKTNDEAVGANTSAISAMKAEATITTFKGLEDEIAKKQDIIPENTYDAYGAASAVEGKLTEHATTAANTYETKTDASAKLTEAKGYTDTEVAKVQGEVDSLEAYVGTFTASEGVDTVVKYIDAKTANIASDETVGAIDNRVKAIEADYLKGADKTELEGKITAEKERAEGVEEGLQSAIDAINNTDTGILAKAQEYADGKDEAIAAAKKAGDDAQADVDALAGKVGEVPADKTVVQMIAEAQAAATYDDTEVRGLISDNADAIALLNDGADVEGSVDYKIAQAVAAIMENPDETMNSINELVTWINDHATDALELSNKVSANEQDIAALEGLVGTTGVATQIENAIAAALKVDGVDKYALASDLTADIARIAALEGKSHEHANKALLDTYTQTEADLADAVAKKHAHENATVLDGITAEKVAAWDAAEKNAKDHADGLNTAMNTRVEALEAIDHSHANATVLDGITAEKVAAWDKVSEKANDADLAAIAKTGSTDDLVQGEMVLVFDCGNAGVNA